MRGPSGNDPSGLTGAAHPVRTLPSYLPTHLRLSTPTLFLNGPYMGGLVITSLMLESVFDLTTAVIGLVILPRPIAFSIGAALAGRGEERFGGRRLTIVGTSKVVQLVIRSGSLP